MFSYHHQTPADVIWKDRLLLPKSTDCDSDEDNSHCECSIKLNPTLLLCTFTLKRHLKVNLKV